MTEIVALIVGCVCIFAGLFLWFVGHKNHSKPGGSIRTFWAAVFSGNMLLLWGLSVLVSQEVLPGGHSVDSLLNIGATASLLAYIYTVRPSSPNIKINDKPNVESKPKPLRIPH